MPPATEPRHETTKIEIYENAAKQLQCSKQKHAHPDQEQSGVLVSAEPVGQPFAERLRQEENCHCPYTRRDAGDEQKARQRHAQKSGCEISRQSRAGDKAAEDQNGRPAFGKPAFALRDFRGEAAEGRTLEPSASGVACK